MANIGDRYRVAFVVVFAAVVAWVLTAPFDGGAELSSSELPPQGFIYVSEASELILSQPVGEETLIAELDDDAIVPAASSIESIEPLGQRSAFVGFCCIPAGGRQLIVDLDSGRIEFFPLTLRFPSTSATGDVVLSGGEDVRVENLGALVAYENGVGVVAPGPLVGEAAGDEVLRPASLPMDRAALVTNGVLRIIGFEGEVLAETAGLGLEIVDYDARNDLLVTLVASETVRLLTADTLEFVDEWALRRPARAIDVVDGWVLTSSSDGSIGAVRIDGSDDQTLVNSGGGVAAWIPRS